MDSLPSEIFAQILGYLDDRKKRIGYLACVSARWQCEVERITFRDLTVKTIDIKMLKQLFAKQNIRRRYYLQSLTIQFVPPDALPGRGSEYMCCEVERHINETLIKDSFIRGISRVFGLLHDFSIMTPLAKSLNLTFTDDVRCSCSPCAKRKGKKKKKRACKRQEFCTGHERLLYDIQQKGI